MTDTKLNNYIFLSALFKAQQEVAHDTGNGNAASTSASAPRLITLPFPPTRSHHNIIIQQATPSMHPQKPSKKQHWTKPNGMPKRPLSAYNLFFKSERQRMVSATVVLTKFPLTPPTTKGKRGKTPGIGFAGMARAIAAKWKTLPSSDMFIFKGQARIEKARYYKEMVVWRLKEASKKADLKDEALKKKKEESEEDSVAVGNSPVVVPAPGYCHSLKQALGASDMTGRSLQTLTKSMQHNTFKEQKQSHDRHEANTSTDQEVLHHEQSHSFSESFFQPSFGLTTSSNYSQTIKEEGLPSNNGYSSSMYEPLPMSCRAEKMISAVSPGHYSLPSHTGEKIIPEGDDIMAASLSIFLDILENDEW